MSCIECEFADAKSNPVYARIGLTRCTKIPAPTAHYHSMTFERECSTFAPAAAEIVAKRREWLEKQLPTKQIRGNHGRG